MEKIKKFFKNCEILDWIIAGIIIVFAFFLYQHPDIRHTGGSSFAYLNGHIWDFYDYNKTCPGIVGNNYMPTMYIIFAIWNIPIRLLGLVTAPTMEVSIFVRLWYKLLTSLFYFGTAYYIFKICRELKIEKKMAMFGAFLFITNPIAIYSQFIFGQYDILTTFFIVLGIYFYVQKKDWKFVMAFAVAMTCKYFAFLFFLPMLLHREKNVIEIIKKSVGVVSLFIFETTFYIHSQAFRDGVFGFGATGYIFDLVLDENRTKVSVVVLAWVVLCACAYFFEPKEKETNWMIYYLNIVTFISFGLSFWHPQWVLMAVPAWVLGTVISKKRDIFMLLECLLMTFYIVFVVNCWPSALDQNLFSGGILPAFLDMSKLGININMREIFIIKDNNLLFTCFVAILFVVTFFKHPKFTQDIENMDNEYTKGVDRLRYLYGMLIFIIPSIFCLVYNYTRPTEIYSIGQNDMEFIGAMANDEVCEQYFTVNAEEITAVNLYIGTYGRENNCDVHVDLIDGEDETIASSVINASNLNDCQYNRFKFDSVDVEPGTQYEIKVYCTNVAEDLSNSVTLAKANSNIDEMNYLVYNQENLDRNLVFSVYGK